MGIKITKEVVCDSCGTNAADYEFLEGHPLSGWIILRPGSLSDVRIHDIDTMIPVALCYMCWNKPEIRNLLIRQARGE